MQQMLSDVNQLPAFLPPPDSFFGKIRDFSVSIVSDSIADMAGTISRSLLDA